MSSNGHSAWRFFPSRVEFPRKRRVSFSVTARHFVRTRRTDVSVENRQRIPLRLRTRRWKEKNLFRSPSSSSNNHEAADSLPGLRCMLIFFFKSANKCWSFALGTENRSALSLGVRGWSARLDLQLVHSSPRTCLRRDCVVWPDNILRHGCYLVQRGYTCHKRGLHCVQSPRRPSGRQRTKVGPIDRTLHGDLAPRRGRQTVWA